jgi:carbonic anhydrase
MSVTDEVLNANEAYARDFKPSHLPMPPSRKLAILACMDATAHGRAGVWAEDW